jgi:hypothetical protein
LFYKIIFRKGKEDANRYRLFKLRDDLVYLVAKGTIKEDDFIFQTFYDMTNTYIQHIHKFNLREINKAMKKAKEKGHFERAAEFTERIISELNNKDPEVKQVIQEFFLTMIDILIKNSLSLRFIIKLYSYTLTQSLIKRFKTGAKIFVNQEDAFRNYQIHDEIYKSLVDASCLV